MNGDSPASSARSSTRRRIHLREAGLFPRGRRRLMNTLTVHHPPKIEESGKVRVITFTRDAVRDVENVLATELQGLTDNLGECHLLLDFTNVEYITSVELGTIISG